MVTFVGADHFLILEDDGLRQIRRLATAFFEAKLQGDQDAAALLAGPWIEGEATRLEPHPSYKTLAWGVAEPVGG